MSEILIIARVRIHEFDVPIVTDYYFEVKDKLSLVEGCNGLSVWRDERDKESFLVIYEYADLAAAERGLLALSQVRVLAETQAADFRPADVQRVRITGYVGDRVAKAPTSAYLSMSQRVADPGYSPELQEDLGRTFDELQIMQGFIGSVYGTNDVLEEEVIGIVTWQSREAFLASLPPNVNTYSIVLYRRFY